MVENIIARHPEWTPEVAEQQLSLLEGKWVASNEDTESESIASMRDFGSRVWHSELLNADYRDKYRRERNPPPEGFDEEGQDYDRVRAKIEELKRKYHRARTLRGS